MRTKGLLVGFLLLLLLAGCGESPTSSLTSVLITRNSPPMLHLQPFSRKITDSHQVQKLYNAAMQLPSASGTANCLTSSYGGLSYELQFYSGSTMIQKMVLDAATCRLLTIGDSDVRMTNPAFINLFVKTAGIPSLLPDQSYLLTNSAVYG